MSVSAMCAALKMSGSTEATTRRQGFTERTGDAAATKLGLNPYEVWPEMRDDSIRECTGLPPVAVVHALVTCLDCARPLTTEHVHVADDGASGVLSARCPVGHANRMTVTVEVA